MKFLITDGQRCHVAGIRTIEQECFSDPWSEQAVLSQLPNENHVFLVALDGETVIGYVGMMHILDEGYISNVAVTGAYRRQGIADALLKQLLEQADRLRLSFVTLEVRQSNAPAQALYAKHGFEPVGLRKGYYTKPKENAVLMTVYLKGENEV